MFISIVVSQVLSKILRFYSEELHFIQSGASHTDVCQFFFTFSRNSACKFILGHTTNSPICRHRSDLISGILIRPRRPMSKKLSILAFHILTYVINVARTMYHSPFQIFAYWRISGASLANETCSLLLAYTDVSLTYLYMTRRVWIFSVSHTDVFPVYLYNDVIKSKN